MLGWRGALRWAHTKVPLKKRGDAQMTPTTSGWEFVAAVMQDCRFSTLSIVVLAAASLAPGPANDVTDGAGVAP
jgi:hypothetical protein